MKLAAIFSDNMVLQRDSENYIFGTSESDEVIYVEIDNIKCRENVKAGDWCFSLPPHAAGGPYLLKITGETSEGSRTESLIENVLYGEVWLCNGQSNIEFELKDSKTGPEDLKNSSFPEIRYFNVIKAPLIDEDFLNQEKNLTWKPCTDGCFGDVSAIGYYYAVRLQEELGFPVGIIDCYQGGSSITCWLERNRLEKLPEAASYLEAYVKTISQTEEEHISEQSEYDRINEDYCLKLEELLRTKPGISNVELINTLGNGPWPPPLWTDSLFRPAGLVETMLKRVAPYTVKGVIFYQGEEDAYRNYEDVLASGENRKYKAMLNCLLDEYRDFFKNPDIPVLIFQLPMYGTTIDEDVRDWAYLREAQEEVSEENKNVYMTAILDAGEYCNIHPLDKVTPAERMAGTAFKYIYHKTDVAGSDMLLKNMYVKKDGDGQNINLVLEFENIYDGIIICDNTLPDVRNESEGFEDASLHNIYGFEISDDGINWRVPDLELSEDSIIVKCIDDAEYIRYGFFNFGKVNVYNGKGFMLRPFSRRIVR
ncbi:MAG: hypothetical protein K6F55_09090 [Eubacterium sp.]|nr:hypothetical protein [Eubacterium sp.]